MGEDLGEGGAGEGVGDEHAGEDVFAFCAGEAEGGDENEISK